MDQKQFNLWCQRELPKLRIDLVKTYPKCKLSIQEDVSDFYVHALERLQDIKDIKAYLFGWIFNRHYRFFSNRMPQRSGYLTHRSSLKIKLVENYVDDIQTPEIEDEIITLHLDNLRILIEQLPLHDQKLYQLYYVENQSLRKIATEFGITHSGVHRQIQRMRKKLKEQLTT